MDHSDAGSSRSGCYSEKNASDGNVSEYSPTGESKGSIFPPSGTIDLKSLVSENQSIKLIPSVEEVVRNNGFAFDPNLDNNTKMWLKQLQNTWNLWKKGSNVLSSIHDYFARVEDPFSSVLRLVINCPAFMDCKPNTLPHQIVNELKIWSQPRKEAIRFLLTSNLKFTAFNVAKEQKNFSFIKLVVDVYEIIEERENILPHVKCMLEASKYKAAHQSILALNLHDKIDIHDLLIPLVLQDKLNLVDEYLVKCPDQAKALVKFLDDLLLKKESIKSKIDHFLVDRPVPYIRWEKLYHKPIGKLISRLCNTYNIPMRMCKNLNRHRVVGGIRFLIHQKYQESVISDNAWNDLVIDTMSDNPDLVIELVKLVDEYDTKEAYKWALHFHLPEDMYPESVRIFRETSPLREECNEEVWDAVPSTSQNINCYPLNLPTSKIVFVDNMENFKNAIFDGLSGELLIGIDSEWKPSFGAKPSSVSLIQMATKWEIFLFDVLALSGPEFVKLWSVLAEKVFDNSNIIKIGFGLENDIREIRASVPGLSYVKCKGLSYLELATLWKAVLKSGIKMPYQKKNLGEGLSSIVEQCFGLTLQKHEQCSNWENRPLRQSQLEYAALDAYVLLEIYEFIQLKCVELQLNFEDMCYKVMADLAQSKIKKPRKRYSKEKSKYYYNSQGPNRQHVEAKSIGLILESCLVTLASCLRSCGINVVLCQERATWEQCIQEACIDKRFIVIKNTVNKKLSKNIPTNYVYVLHSNSINDQIKEVLTYFSINESTIELYSRCPSCNSNDLVDISQNVMKEMFFYKNKSKNVMNTHDNSTLTDMLPNYNVNVSQQSSSNVYTYHEDFQISTDDNFDTFLSDDDHEDQPGPPNFLLWSLTPGQSIYVDKCCTRNGVPIQLNAVTNTVIDKNISFRICQTCGNCYWDGNYLPESLDNMIMTLLKNKNMC